jgi:hypothetical protein
MKIATKIRTQTITVLLMRAKTNRLWDTGT